MKSLKKALTIGTLVVVLGSRSYFAINNIRSNNLRERTKQEISTLMHNYVERLDTLREVARDRANERTIEELGKLPPEHKIMHSKPPKTDYVWVELHKSGGGLFCSPSVTFAQTISYPPAKIIRVTQRIGNDVEYEVELEPRITTYEENPEAKNYDYAKFFERYKQFRILNSLSCLLESKDSWQPNEARYLWTAHEANLYNQIMEEFKREDPKLIPIHNKIESLEEKLEEQ